MTLRNKDIIDCLTTLEVDKNNNLGFKIVATFQQKANNWLVLGKNTTYTTFGIDYSNFIESKVKYSIGAVSGFIKNGLTNNNFQLQNFNSIFNEESATFEFDVTCNEVIL